MNTDVMQVRQYFDKIADICDSIDEKGWWNKPDTVKLALRDILKNDIEDFIMYLSASDGTVSNEEIEAYRAITGSTSDNFSEIATETEEGTYADNGDGSISFTLHGKNYIASFNVDGFLELKANGEKELFAQTVSNLGQWSANGLTLTLNGIQKNGLGSALYMLDDGTKYSLVYEASQTEGYAVLYLSNNGSKGDFFGYCALNKTSNTLTATLSDPNNAETGYTQYQLYLYDDYKGEWIT